MRVWKAMVAATLAAVAIGASAVSDRADAKAPARPFLEGAEIDSATRAVLTRDCANCHSEKVDWPWYSHVPPLSWMIHRDVAQARARVNFSRWAEYSREGREERLAAIGAAARAGVMPPGRYTALHRESRLSEEDRERVYRWTRSERRRLRAGI